MKEILNRVLLTFGLPVLTGILIYFVFITRENKDDSTDMLTEEQIIDSEIEYLYKNISIVDDLKKQILKNQEKINQSNCVAVLEDKDKDGSLDIEGLLTSGLKYAEAKKHSIIIYYNVCNLKFVENNDMTFALTTDKLVNILYGKRDQEDFVDHKFFYGVMYQLSDIDRNYKKALIPLEVYLR